MLSHSSRKYGRTAENRIQHAREYGIGGARALVETFYYAFNQRDMEVFAQVWANHELIQLNNPLGGILRGYETIANLYRGILTGPARVWVELDDIVEFESDTMVVFAGRETGEFTRGDKAVSLSIRTSRIVQWMGPEAGWKQTHHHGSIDNPQRLEEYQMAVRG
ncbi:MAG: nuclear transport factor 2 family protein [Gallionella sp.]|nr:nuclear transport factor 2 family protein [Gallionella sp.]MDD4946886.1 nuclear transport factor 2 family protein [Gallionella sp.]